MLFTKNYNILIGAIFIIGSMSTIRMQVSIVYLYEIMMRQSWTLTYTLISLAESLVGLLAVLYFNYVSNDWQPFF